MRVSVLKAFAVAAVIALIAAGCAKKVSQLTGPSGVDPGSRAPLISRALGGRAIDGEYIVVFKRTVGNTASAVSEMTATLNVTPRFQYSHALKGFAARLSPTAIEALRNDPRVAYIEQDQIAHAVATQANPTWAIDRVDQRSLPLDNSYTYNQTGAGVDAYIIDTGIRITHTDFGGRAVAGVDEITPGGSANDGNGHGTHVSGTVGGATYGIAKGVHLIAVRVLDNSGSGTYSQVIAGVDWVTGDHTTHPAVANMSLGGPVSTALDDAVRASIVDGVTYCIAAGNSSADASTQSPADVSQAITVGATSSNDAWASFSNFGSLVDILAPGVSVTSDWNTSNTATNTISGTSMATPHVTGAAALYLEANPGSTPAQVSSGLTSAASSGKISGVPGGTVNLLLYSLIGSGPPPPTVPDPPVLASPGNGSTGVSRTPTLSWNASAGATSYHVQVSTSSTFSSLVYDQSGVTSTSVALPQLGSRTSYYWHVNGSNANGTGAYSGTWSFRTRRN